MVNRLARYAQIAAILSKYGFGIFCARADLLPPPLIDELLVLTDDVKPVAYEKVQVVIEETCGAVGEFCIFVDPEPFAAASLSQVHRATLTDGSEVVFKAQQPDIRELIEVDLTILDNFARRVEVTARVPRPPLHRVNHRAIHNHLHIAGDPSRLDRNDPNSRWLNPPPNHDKGSQ
jgi:hypothetical protein